MQRVGACLKRQLVPMVQMLMSAQVYRKIIKGANIPIIIYWKRRFPMV